jgi:Flp pilus assembly protein TadB
MKAWNSRSNKIYKCPVCGQKAIIGQHFCRVMNSQEMQEADERRQQKRRRVTRLFSIVVAAIMIIALLFSRLGKHAITILLAAAAIALLAMTIRYVSQRKSQDNYEELIAMLGDNQAAADRLIHNEQARQPGMNRKDCIALIVERLRHEKSR